MDHTFQVVREICSMIIPQGSRAIVTVNKQKLGSSFLVILILFDTDTYSF